MIKTTLTIFDLSLFKNYVYGIKFAEMWFDAYTENTKNDKKLKALSFSSFFYFT